jgi:hypothetical protein
MKRLFVIAFIAGLLSVALAAALWPLPQHVRFRSLITVPPDGGRQEDFVIRWPEDRIARPSEARTELPPMAAAGSAVLEDSAGRRASAEMFRLRDTEDNVIGVAARLAGTGGAVAGRGRAASSWLLVIPSRGALFLAQTDVIDSTVRAQLTADGSIALPPAQSAVFWREGPRFRVTATVPTTAGSQSAGRVLRGTSEFAGLTGSFTETWNLAEVSVDGSTQGRIVLSTFTASGS